MAGAFAMIKLAFVATFFILALILQAISAKYNHLKIQATTREEAIKRDCEADIYNCVSFISAAASIVIYALGR